MFGRLDTDKSKHRLIGELRLARPDHDPHIADPQAGRRPKIHLAAAEVRAWRDESPVGKTFDDKGLQQRRVAGNAGFAAERQRHGLSRTGRMRRARRFRIDDHADGGLRRAILQQRTQHAGSIGIAAGTGIVLRIRNHDRPRRGRRARHGASHAFVGREDAPVECTFLIGNQFEDGVCRLVRISLRLAIGDHHRPAIGEIRRGKSRCKRQRWHRLALLRRQMRIDALARLDVGALPTDRNQERQLPECFCKAALGAEQERHVAGRSPAGIRHVDMRIGAIGDQRVRMFHHSRRDIRVQVETDHQRQVRSDQLAHAREQFALPVVKVFGHHGAMKIEINTVERSRCRDAVDDHGRDALKGIFADVSRRTRRAPHRRHQFPVSRFSFGDEARKPNIDVPDFLKNDDALFHCGPAAAMNEAVVFRLGRRECIGLVQETADGDPEC